MKIMPRQIEAFVRKPDPQARLILVYGPDTGLVRERAAAIGRSLVADLNDPFNAVTLTAGQIADDPARLADEAASMSMMGGGRLIRIEDAGDALAPLFKDYLASPSPHNLIVAEAGALGAKSALRALCEKSAAAAALPCYVDEGRDLAGLIRDTLREAGFTADQDAIAWLARNIAGDRQRIRTELDKLALYMGAPGTIRLHDAIACCGEAGVQSLDDLAGAVASAEAETALRCYGQLLQEGVPAVSMLRSMQTHFRRLHVTRARIDGGASVEDAMRKLSPPVFFKQEEAFKAQLRRWTLARLDAVLQRLSLLEAQTKQTGTPVEALCGQALLSLSRMR